MLAGIILAAGASSRMGSPKALLDYRGETFLDRLIRVLGGVADSVIVALGYDADRIQKAVRGPAQFVINPDPSRGQLSSLQTALGAVPSEAEGFLFIPVDCPAVEPETVVRLAQTFAKRDPATLLVIPRIAIGKGAIGKADSGTETIKRGHPVCAARSLIAEFMALPPGGQAKDVIHRHVGRTEYVDVQDAGILTDVDDPAAYRRLAAVPEESRESAPRGLEREHR